MFINYEKYLESIDKLLKKYFEQQKEYINCKPGCSLCCEEGEYPFSNLEFKYLLLGSIALSEDEKNIINTKISKIKADQEESKEKVFLYECPFLIDKKCSIYKYRGIICRTHGLMFYLEDKNGEAKNKGPMCMTFGLNYSNVYDKDTKIISQEMWEKTGIKTEPVAFNISLKAIQNSLPAKQLNIDFGESKALIDWF